MILITVANATLILGAHVIFRDLSWEIQHDQKIGLIGCTNACAEVRSIDVPEQPTWSTSTAGGLEPGAITLEICRRVIDRRLLVTEAEIIDAARRLYREDGELVEGAAAVAVAAFLKSADDYAGKTVALLICGGNAEPDFEALVGQHQT